MFLKCTYGVSREKKPIVEIRFYPVIANKEFTSAKISERNIEPININVYPKCKSARTKKLKSSPSGKAPVEYVGNFNFLKEFNKVQKNNYVIYQEQNSV